MMMVVVVMIVRMVRMVRITDAQRMTSGGQSIRTGPLERELVLQELRVELAGALEVEAADIEHLVQRKVAVARAVHLRHGIDVADATLQFVEGGRGDEVGLVEQNHVRETNLLHGFIVLIEMLGDVGRVDHGHNRVEAKMLLDLVVGEERLSDRRRVREAGGLDEDAVEPVLALEQPAEDADQVAAHAAADAPVVHLEQLLVAADDQLVVDADLPELVLDHRELLAVVLREDAVEEGGLAGAEEAGEDGDGNLIGHEEDSDSKEGADLTAKGSVLQHA